MDDEVTIKDKIDKLYNERDQLVLRLKAEGKTLREIGKQTGYSYVTIKQVLDKYEKGGPRA